MHYGCTSDDSQELMDRATRMTMDGRRDPDAARGPEGCARAVGAGGMGADRGGAGPTVVANWTGVPFSLSRFNPVAPGVSPTSLEYSYSRAAKMVSKTSRIRDPRRRGRRPPSNCIGRNRRWHRAGRPTSRAAGRGWPWTPHLAVPPWCVVGPLKPHEMQAGRGKQRPAPLPA